MPLFDKPYRIDPLTGKMTGVPLSAWSTKSFVARWFGPALVSGTFDNFWIWILGPAIGALLAGFAYDRLLLKGTAGE